ncbi:MAG: fibronectin type III domain-containing protein [Paramuribaculum sp.]|nr:fibronectin type III domain-containing protein [Paramuribaculum sp.]
MSKFRKLMAAAALLFAASSVFVACSDDNYPKNVMGPIVVNSLQTTSNSVTAYWTVVSDGSCDGYKVVINEGTRASKGAEVINKTFAPKEFNSTFTGLTPNTSYVITTQAIPSATSGRTEADTYEMEFVTAPLVSGIAIGTITYEDVPLLDAEGNLVNHKKGTATVTWNAIAATNCGGYTVNLEAWELAKPNEPESDTNKYDWRNKKSETVATPATTSVTFKQLIDPEVKYRARVRPNPSNACWYAAGEFSASPEVTAPAAE